MARLSCEIKRRKIFRFVRNWSRCSKYGRLQYHATEACKSEFRTWNTAEFRRTSLFRVPWNSAEFDANSDGP
jgi:hypothetical protein